MWGKNLITWTCSTIGTLFTSRLIFWWLMIILSRGCSSLKKSLLYVSTGGFWLPLNSFYYVFFRVQFQTFLKHSGGQVVLKTVILVFPISIIVIKVGDVFLLPYSNIFTQHYEFESEMFRLLSFKFLLMILWQERALGSTKPQFKIIIGWMRKIIMLFTILYIS